MVRKRSWKWSWRRSCCSEWGCWCSSCCWCWCWCWCCCCGGWWWWWWCWEGWCDVTRMISQVASHLRGDLSGYLDMKRNPRRLSAGEDTRWVDKKHVTGVTGWDEFSSSRHQFVMICAHTHIYMYILYLCVCGVPVVPHKAVAEVSKIGNL